MAELNSAPYFPIDLKGLTALCCARRPTPTSPRAPARRSCGCCEIVALSAHQGMLTASQGRCYEHTLCAGRSLELSGIARLLWGKGWLRPPLSCPAAARALPARPWPRRAGEPCRHRRPSGGRRTRNGASRRARTGIAALYHYKTRDFAMGSAAYRWNEWGYQETVLHLRLGERPEAQVWINHPGETIHSGYGRPSYWGGCGTLPRVHQYRGLAVLDFPPSTSSRTSPMPGSRAEFDEVRVDGNLALARSGRGRGDAVAAAPTLQLVKRRPDRRMRSCASTAAATRWIVRVCEASERRQRWKHVSAALAVEENADGNAASSTTRTTAR